MLIEDICDIWVPLSFSFPAEFHLVLGFCSGWILSHELRGRCHHLQLAVGVLVRSPVPVSEGVCLVSPEIQKFVLLLLVKLWKCYFQTSHSICSNVPHPPSFLLRIQASSWPQTPSFGQLGIPLTAKLHAGSRDPFSS